MATIKDVAREAGVSVATVSRVINKSPKASQASIDTVTSAMHKLGYRPNAAARALVNQSTNTIGVLVSDVSDPFFGTLVKAVDTVAHREGKHLLIGNGYHRAEEERRALELLKTLVLINRHIPQLADRCISLDNQKGAYLATDFLIRQGHRNIACISSSHQIEDADQRIAGYQQALNEHGITLSSSYIEKASPDSEGGEQAMTNLLVKSLPFTAVVAYNDNMAAGALLVLEENGHSVPEHVSVIGFDDALISRYLRPRLTTVRYPIQLMAEKATQLALALATDAPRENDPMIFSPTIVRRDSVAQKREP